VADLEAIIESGIDRANAKKQPTPLQFDTREAAHMLGVPVT